MFEFKSMSKYQIKGKDCYGVKNPIECNDFDHLVGVTVVIDGELKKVIGVESFCTAPPCRKDEKIGLMVKEIIE